MSAHDSRSHSHSGEPTEEFSVRGPERLATWSNEETLTSKHSGWRGRRWCCSVQQTTRQRVPQCTIAGNRAEQSPTKGAVCRPSSLRLQRRGVPATHKSGHKHGMAEFTTSLETTPSTRAARGGEGSEWCCVQPDHAQHVEKRAGREHVGQHVDGRTARRDDASPWQTKAPHRRRRWVRRSWGETDALANSDAGRASTPADWVNSSRWMILMKRNQKSGPTAGRKERTYSWYKRADPQRVRRA